MIAIYLIAYLSGADLLYRCAEGRADCTGRDEFAANNSVTDSGISFPPCATYWLTCHNWTFVSLFLTLASQAIEFRWQLSNSCVLLRPLGTRPLGPESH
jgi:hypothetical protein